MGGRDDESKVITRGQKTDDGAHASRYLVAGSARLHHGHHVPFGLSALLISHDPSLLSLLRLTSLLSILTEAVVLV